MNVWTSKIMVGLTALLLVGVPSALAAPVATSNGSAGQGLEISPPVIELSGAPGQSITTTIRIRNVTKGVLIAKGKADDFGADANEDGQPKLLLDETGETRYSLKFWVESVPDLELAPQELKNNTIKINIPRNAEPGGHFGVIRFTAVPPNLNGTGVALSASVGALVLLKVSGTITEKLSVASFTTERTVKTKGKPDSFEPSSFFENGPFTFGIRLKNEGNVHEKAVGTVDISGLFGNKVVSVPVNEKGGNVLPDSIRKFEETLNQKNLFGYYTAKLNLTYLNGTQKITATTGFWVIPWKLILGVIILLVILFFALKAGIRRYNASIIAKARR